MSPFISKTKSSIDDDAWIKLKQPVEQENKSENLWTGAFSHNDLTFASQKCLRHPLHLKRSTSICSQGRARPKITTTQIKSSVRWPCPPAAITPTESWPSGASSAASPASESLLWLIQSRYFLFFYPPPALNCCKVTLTETNWAASPQKWTPNSRMILSPQAVLLCSSLIIVTALISQTDEVRDTEHNHERGNWSILQSSLETPNRKWNQQYSLFLETGRRGDRSRARHQFFTTGKEVWHHLHRDVVHISCLSPCATDTDLISSDSAGLSRSLVSSAGPTCGLFWWDVYGQSANGLTAGAVKSIFVFLVLQFTHFFHRNNCIAGLFIHCDIYLINMNI